MTVTTTSAEIAATRHLIGLTQQDLADKLGVGRAAVRDWERGKFTPRPGVVTDLAALRARHDRAVTDLLGDDRTIYLPDGPEPTGWYLAIAARVLDREPDREIEWL